MERRKLVLSVAGALAGAVSLAASVASTQAAGVKCYGISTAGKNDCANAAATHSCAGQSTADYSGQDWKAVADEAACAADDGTTQPFDGKNPKKA